MTISSSEREVASEEEHRDETYDVARSAAGGADEVIHRDDHDTDQRDKGSDDFAAIDALVREYPEEEWNGDGHEVDDKRGLRGTGHASAVVP